MLDELKFTGSTPTEEFDWRTTAEATRFDASDRKAYDIASLYNLNDVINEDAVGFNNLEARAANIE